METTNSTYQYTMFKVVGDSMDNGKRNSFADGDTICTKQVETSDLAQAIQGDLGSYWVICTDEGTWLRQVVSYDSESGLHGKALNPRCEDVFFGREEVKSLYRVMTLQPKTVCYHELSLQ